MPDVRSSGMGCVDNGISKEISSLYLNPAGLANIKYYQLSFSHLIWPIKGLYFSEDLFVQYEYFCFAHELKKSAFGINLSHYHQPDIKFQDRSYSVYSGFSSITHAYNLYPFLTGIRGKIIWEVLGDYNAKAFGMDFGIIGLFHFMKFYKGNTPNCQVGISAYNIGNGIILRSKREVIPANIQIGYSYIFFKNNESCLLFANDYKFSFGYKDGHKKLTINTGLEYAIMKILFLRSGYIFSVPVNKPSYADFRNNKFTIGAGAEYDISSFQLKADYSYIMSLTIDEYHTHSISIILRRIKNK